MNIFQTWLLEFGFRCGCGSWSGTTRLESEQQAPVVPGGTKTVVVWKRKYCNKCPMIMHSKIHTIQNL